MQWMPEKWFQKKRKVFAQSLQDHCVVPVTIGTSEIRVFPIDVIVDARPLIVSSVVEAAKRVSSDYNSMVNLRREKAMKVITAMEKEIDRQADLYGPFAQFLT